MSRTNYYVDHVFDNEITVCLLVEEKHLRSGGRVSGPSMFALAVKPNCAIGLMCKPDADSTAKGRLLKLGKQLGVSDVLIFSEMQDKPVAWVSLTYAIQPK